MWSLSIRTWLDDLEALGAEAHERPWAFRKDRECWPEVMAVVHALEDEHREESNGALCQCGADADQCYDLLALQALRTKVESL